MKRILFALLILSFTVSCKERKPELTQQQRDQQRIDSLDTVIRKSVQQSENPDMSLAMEAIKAYTYYADDYPQDSLSADYLFKAAQIYEGVLGNYPQAINLYNKVYAEYENYKKRPMALFYQANAYHQVQDTSNAILHFERFREQFPSHAFADDAEAMIRFIRMDEEQLQNFLQKDKQEPAQ